LRLEHVPLRFAHPPSSSPGLTQRPSIRRAWCFNKRGGRDKPGHDDWKRAETVLAPRNLRGPPTDAPDSARRIIAFFNCCAHTQRCPEFLFILHQCRRPICTDRLMKRFQPPHPSRNSKAKCIFEQGHGHAPRARQAMGRLLGDNQRAPISSASMTLAWSPQSIHALITLRDAQGASDDTRDGGRHHWARPD
jgi:hypothetical protein